MKLTNSFTVPASVEEAWAVLLDIERVAPCLPGATLEGTDDDGAYKGAMAIKLGPVRQTYRGTVRIESADEAARRLAMRAQARDARGGTAAATITSALAPAGGGGTDVTVETDLRVTGPAAQFGRGVMQDVSKKLLSRFADCLAEEIARTSSAGANSPEAPSPAVEQGPAASPTEQGTEETAVGPLPTGPAGDAAEAARTSSAGANSPEAPSPASHAQSEPGGASRERPTEDVLDLGEASRGAVLKRAVPTVAMLAAIGGIVTYVLRRRK